MLNEVAVKKIQHSEKVYEYSLSDSYEAFKSFISEQEYTKETKHSMFLLAEYIHKQFPNIELLQDAIDKRGIIELSKNISGSRVARASGYLYFLYMIRVLKSFKITYFYGVNPKTINRLIGWYEPYFYDVGMDEFVNQCLDVGRRISHRDINVSNIRKKVLKTGVYLLLKYAILNIKDITKKQWKEFVSEAKAHASHLQNYTCNIIIQQALFEMQVFDELLPDASSVRGRYLTPVHSYDNMPNIKPLTDAYMNYCNRTLAESTCRHKVSTLDAFFKFIEKKYNSDFSLDNLTRDIVVNYITSVHDTTKSLSRKQELIYNVKQFLYFIASNKEEFKSSGYKIFEQNILVVSDFTVQSDNYMPRPIGEEELQVLLMSLREISSAKFRLAFLIMLLTGVSLSDLLNLKYDCIRQISDGTYVMNIWRTKIKKTYQIKINFNVVELINKVKEDNTQIEPLPHPDGSTTIYLFNDGGRKCHKSWFTRYFKFLKDIASQNATDISETISKVTPHRLRHTFASILRDKGVDIYTLKYLLGHENIITTDKYIAESDKEKIKYIKELEKGYVCGATNELETILKQDMGQKMLSDMLDYRNNLLIGKCLVNGYKNCSMANQCLDCMYLCSTKEDLNEMFSMLESLKNSYDSLNTQLKDKNNADAVQELKNIKRRIQILTHKIKILREGNVVNEEIISEESIGNILVLE